MDESLVWLIYNAVMFGSLYALAKVIERYTWHVIENFEKYENILSQWRP